MKRSQWFNRMATWSVVLACGGSLCGCPAAQRREQLDRVAKDWCETIRAAQVIPIFPIKQDVQPGDVYLVQRSLADQRKDFKKRGPLALDFRLTRFGKSPSFDYGLVYFDGYFKDAFGSAPHDRVSRLPGDSTSFVIRMRAPACAFPAYSFDVRSGSSANIAIPLQGVPVGLSFMQTGNATGSVNLKDAYSYAADADQVYRMLQRWAEGDAIRVQLSDHVRRNGERPVFLRVVTEVYLVGGVTVSLFNREAGGASASVGTVAGVPIFDSTTGDLTSNYDKLLNLLSVKASDTAQDSARSEQKPTTKPATGSASDPPVGPAANAGEMPPATAPASTAPSTMPAETPAPAVGGNVRFTWASDRTVSMDEQFARPMVVGFLGFDVPVYPGGVLGYPLPTWTSLNGKAGAQTLTVSQLSVDQEQANANLDWLVKADAEAVMRLEIMTAVIRGLGTPREFAASSRKIEEALKTPGSESLLKGAQASFEEAALDYISRDTGYQNRASMFNDAFIAARQKRR